MNTNNKINNRIFRDGVSQKDRLLKALEPDYVAVDERDKSDLLSFVQEYATKLNYYDESNNINGDWSRFFAGDVKQMVAYINNPESFADDRSTVRQLSQPHLVLLFAFLQLLRYPQQQFKALTQRYLDFYYKEVLKLNTKEEVPDKVNVIFELAKGEETHLIKQGTLLNAGQDSQGINLNYATDEDIIVNQAQVASIKTLFLEKNYINDSISPIKRSEIKNIYASSIVDTKKGKATRSQRFNTLGNITTSQDHFLGFAIASPVLSLKAGKRTITLTLSCQRNTLNTNIINEIIEGAKTPFEIYLSSEKEWIKIEDSVLAVGDFIVGQELKSYNNSLFLDSSLNCTAEIDTFEESDHDRFFVFKDGKIYQIAEYRNQREVKLSLVGQLSSSNDTIKQYSASGIYFNSLQFQLTLGDKVSAIAPLKSNQSSSKIAFSSPAVKILLKPEENEAGKKNIYYEQFKSVLLEKVNIQVKVENIQDVQIRNDSSVLNTKTPFQLFGNNPKVGSSFYFSNSEISQKKLDTLAINMEWMGLPKDFGEHYKAYLDTEVIEEKITNNIFKASLKLLNNRSWMDIESPKSIFTQESNTLSNPIQLNYQNFNIPGYSLDTSIVQTDSDDLFEQSRYFKLELESPDFAHDLYSVVLNKVALSTEDAIKSLPVYPPYTPEVKTISLDYTASVEIDLQASPTEDQPSQIFHLHPFGYADIQTLNQDNSTDKPKYYLLPHYENEGTLYIGIRNLQPLQNISILFQMIAGSGNVELTQPQIQWSYLSGNSWREFHADILSDSTNGLVDTGLIRLSMPDKATTEHNLLPSGLHWLRATVTENAAAIPDTHDIKTQAVRATFVNQGNTTEHLSKSLAANPIQGFVTRNPAIKTVQQPYSSFGGKSKEDNRAFTMRVSERLRHKQRAITPWDYERLVLEHFPQIYKVKCITSTAGKHNPGDAKVTVVVVPDISNTAPFFPLEPKAPLYLLKEIQIYLQKYTSPFVQIVVKNPRYERIKYRVAIHFRPGYDQGYYLNQLNEDIKRFLSPWAYEEQADIEFGSSIHSSSVIYFIEKRPYVDYIANLKLFEQVGIKAGSGGKSDTYYQVNPSNLAQVQHPNSILVSASEHIIDLIDENYNPEDFEGIGYMIIEYDFVIS